MRQTMNHQLQKYRVSLIALPLLVLVGCTSSLTLEPKIEVPAPLTSPLPLQVGVHYPEAFRQHVYTENSADRENWTIKTGAAHVALFDRVLSSVFADLVHVEENPLQGHPALDVVVVPEIVDMQFALPQETRTDLYEVWIKYSVVFYDQDGRSMEEWPISGYGKTSVEMFKSRDDGLNGAMLSAFRDVGAKLTLGFANRPAIRQLLADKQVAPPQAGLTASEES